MEIIKETDNDLEDSKEIKIDDEELTEEYKKSMFIKQNARESRSKVEFRNLDKIKKALYNDTSYLNKNNKQLILQDVETKNKLSLRSIIRFFSFNYFYADSNKINFEAELSNKVNDWNFDPLIESFDYLHLILRKIFEPFIAKFEINLKTFYNFTKRAEYYYSRNGNPFHNFFHGVAVVHSGLHIMNALECFKDLLDDSLQFAFLLGCFGHDLDHTGRNNPFEIATSSKLAIRYHDESPLERHHAAVLFKIIFSHLPNEKNQNENCNILKMFEPEDLTKLRKYIIEIILATDMKFHFELLGNYK